MRGLAVLAAVYALGWVVVLVPGAVLLFRRGTRPPAVAEECVDGEAARIAEARVSLASAALEMDAGPVPAVPAVDRPAPLRSGRAVRVRGSLQVPAGTVVESGLVVDGDLRIGPQAQVMGPVVARGRVHIGRGARLGALVVCDNDVVVGSAASVQGTVVAGGSVVVGAGGNVAGDVRSQVGVVMREGAEAAGVRAPVLRAASADGRTTPPPRVRRLREPSWTPLLDDALREAWTRGRLSEITQAMTQATGIAVRGVHVLDRAATLGLFELGVPARPGILGRRPAWLVGPATVRVGSDLRIPAHETVSFTLVVEGSLEAFDGAVLEAGVRAGRGLLLRTSVVAHRQVVSDGVVMLHQDAAVLGPVSSSSNVILRAGARAGERGGGGVHADGWIGLEPGASVLGGAQAGRGIRVDPRSRDDRLAAGGAGG